MGACVPVAGEALPFAPLAQALRSLRGSEWDEQVPLPAELARLVPTAADPDEPVAVGEPLPPLRLFEATLGLLRRLGRIRPVVHVVEDLHWADPGSLDLLRFLATNLTGERVLLLLTYRSDEPVEGSPLLPWLAELGRMPVTERIDLGRLTAADTRLLISRLTGGPPSGPLVESTLARSDGNPLFVEHLVDSVAAGDTDLPGTLRELLRARVARHGGATRRLLRAASVVGRVMPLSLLATMADESMEEVEEALRPALEQHLLEIRGDADLGFRHPALREVVYAELLPGERARWHRAAAVALAGNDDPTTVGEVARHWHLAGDLRSATVASARAGYAAERIYAFADAHTSFSRAAELMGSLTGEDPSDPEVASLDRPVLLEHAAQAASLVGEHEDAVRAVSAALDEVHDPLSRARLLERLGAFEFFAGRGDRAETAYREALALLPDGEVSAMAAGLHAGLALTAAAWSRLDEAQQVGQVALSMARSTGARRAEGVALDALGVAAAAAGNPGHGAELLVESLTVARELSVPDDVAIVYVNLIHVLGQANRIAEAAAVGLEGVEAVRRFGLMRQYGGLLLSNVGDCLIRSGRYAEADDVVRQALSDQPRGIQAAPALLQSGRLAMITGDLALAWERMEQARVIVEAESAPDAWQREVYEALSEAELWLRRPAAAFDLAVDGLTICCGGDERLSGQTLVMLGLRALADQAEVLRPHDHQRHRLRRQRAELTGLAEQLDPDPLRATHGSSVEALPVALTCRAELARLDGGDAVTAWQCAEEAWTATGRPFAVAYSRWRLAEARLHLRVDAAGTEALRRAWDAAVRLGARPLVQELETLAGVCRIELAPREAAGVPAQVTRATALDAFALTPREREVLEGLAVGRTNQEIADSLFISVKTASVHVSNILRKMGVSGRQEAGRLAHRLGLGHPHA
jgi:DNA-binding CsgD family transcriptional regulator/tetratricopeptide (TPR) repeat protein